MDNITTNFALEYYNYGECMHAVVELCNVRIRYLVLDATHEWYILLVLRR